MGLFLRKNHLLRCWGSRSPLNWIRALTFSLLLKLPISGSGWEVFTKNIQLMLEFLKASCSILGPTLFLLYINDFPDDVICNIAIFSDNTALYCKCDQASDLWQQLELTSKLESYLQGTVDWGRIC